MATRFTCRAACLLALTLAMTSSFAATSKDVEAALSRDGLQKISVKGVELAYARPGATLAPYKRVKLDPVEIELRKAPDPSRSGSAVKLSDDEREKIRADVARVVTDELAKELQQGNAYR